MITGGMLRDILEYDQYTGVFKWRFSGHGTDAGKIAGYVDWDGYRRIQINGTLYLAHRLAILYTYDRWPTGTVDHIDRCRDHNWLRNLREATMAAQGRNKGRDRRNVSGVAGVYWNVTEGKFHAQVSVCGKHRHLGFFTDKLEAACHRYAAEQCLGWDKWNSNSSAKQFILKGGTDG